MIGTPRRSNSSAEGKDTTKVASGTISLRSENTEHNNTMITASL